MTAEAFTADCLELVCSCVEHLYYALGFGSGAGVVGAVLGICEWFKVR